MKEMCMQVVSTPQGIQLLGKAPELVNPAPQRERIHKENNSKNNTKRATTKTKEEKTLKKSTMKARRSSCGMEKEQRAYRSTAEGNSVSQKPVQHRGEGCRSEDLHRKARGKVKAGFHRSGQDFDRTLEYPQEKRASSLNTRQSFFHQRETHKGNCE